MGDAHQRVVGGVGEGVERLAVRTHDDEVLHVLGAERDVAAHEVGERPVVRGHLEPDHRLAPLGLEGHLLLGRQVAVQPVVAARPPLGPGLLATLLELVGRVVGLVGEAGVQQPLGDVGVDVHPLGLPVRPVRPADLGALVPVEAEPVHDVDEELVRLLAVAGGVGVLDAEDEPSAVVPGERPAEQRGARHADVRIAGGRRAEPGHHRTVHGP